MNLSSRVTLLETELGSGYTQEELSRLAKIFAKFILSNGELLGGGSTGEQITQEEIDFVHRVLPLVQKNTGRRKK
jgi:hypothetical protein